MNMFNIDEHGDDHDHDDQFSPSAKVCISPCICQRYRDRSSACFSYRTATANGAKLVRIYVHAYGACTRSIGVYDTCPLQLQRHISCTTSLRLCSVHVHSNLLSGPPSLFPSSRVGGMCPTCPVASERKNRSTTWPDQARKGRQGRQGRGGERHRQ